jgi:hypothetical protein
MSLVIAGIVGWRSVSPRAKMPLKASTPIAAARVPATTPVRPRVSQATAHSTAITTSTRVRRRPLICRSTTNCSSTITAVLTANPKPITRVDT